jgi:hypothetical protein
MTGSSRRVARFSGDPAARAQADEALGILGEVLGSAAAEWFRASFGDTWQTDRGFRAGVGQRSRAIVDPQELLGRIQEGPEFERVFRPTILTSTRSVLDLARMLRDDRNALVHRTRPWESLDTLRLTDRVTSLLGAFRLTDGSGAERLRAISQESAAGHAGDRSLAIEQIRTEYVESVATRTAHLDLAGIGPRAGTPVLRVRLDEAFVDPTIRPIGRQAEDTVGYSAVVLARRAVLLGAPGSGKTTVLKRLERLLAVAAPPDLPRLTPIRTTARELARAIAEEPGLSLRQFLVRRASDRFGPLFEEEVQLGRAVVLIDGLDEVEHEVDRVAVAGLCRRFAEDYPDVGMIATSRPLGFPREASWSSFAIFEIESFSDAQINEFVGRWSALLGEDGDPNADAHGAQGLIAAIGTGGATQSGIRELAGTPLLLTLLVLIWARGSHLPDQVAELYDIAVMTLLQEWPRRRGAVPLDRTDVLTLLQPVGLRMVAGGETSIGERELRETLRGAWRSTPEATFKEGADAFLEAVGEQTGFFVESGYIGGERHYGFIHKSFAEYVAARELAEQWDSGNLDLADVLHRTRWTETVGLLAGHIGARGRAAATRFIEAAVIAESPWESYLGLNVPWAARMITAGITVRDDVRDSVFSEIVTQATSDRLEPFRSWRLPQAARLASRVPRHVADAVTRPAASDTSATRARKALLRVWIWPDSDAELGGLVEALPDLLASAWDPWVEAHATFTPIDSGFSLAFLFPSHSLLWYGGAEHSIDEEVADRLDRAGVPRLSISDVARSSTWNPVSVWILSLDEIDRTSVEDLVAIADISAATLLQHSFLEAPAWHDRNATAIEQLTRVAPTLSAGLAAFSHGAVEALKEGPGHAAWAKVAVSLAIEGSESARQTSLVRLLQKNFAWKAGLERVVAEAVAVNPVSARAMGVGLGLQGADSEEALAELVEGIAVDSDDPVAEGLARQGLAITTHIDEPLAILMSPNVAVARQDRPPMTDDTTPDVLAVLLGETGDEPERAAAEIARAIIDVAGFTWSELASGDHVVNRSFERLAHQASSSARADTRAWALQILASLDRAPAPELFCRLLADEDATVRDTARDAFDAMDIPNDEWMEDVMPRVWSAEQGEELEFASVQLADMVAADRINDVGALAEAYLDEHPGNGGALFTLWRLAARAPSEHDVSREHSAG